jgi:GNAT superfamily N-acetyltransferase
VTARVREARAEDAPTLVALISDLGFAVTETAIVDRMQVLASQGYPVLVADEGRVIGCLTWNMMAVLHRDTQVGRISMLVVEESRRSGGVGRQLVGAAEDRMRALGCRLIEVTSNEARGEAHLFYQRLGYARTSLRFAKRIEPEREPR